MTAVGRAPLSLGEVTEVAAGKRSARLAPEATGVMLASLRALQAAKRDGRTVYGLTTGVGGLDVRPVPEVARNGQQLALLRSHALGLGPPMSPRAVRAMVLLRAHQLARGCSGVRPVVAEALLGLLEAGVVPVVPSRGSVGASDLAALAHVGLVLVGEGRATVRGAERSGAEALREAGLAPLILEGREGLALINGVCQAVALGVLAHEDAAALVSVGEAVAALTMTALGATAEPMAARSVHTRPHPGVVASAAHLRHLLPAGAGRFREPLSLRCVHQVWGAVRGALGHLEGVLQVEVDGAVDNPQVHGDGWVTSNASSFHAQTLGLAADHATAALVAAAVASQARLARLLDGHRSRGLPPFLVHPSAPAGSSGLMLAEYASASLVAELRARAMPRSVLSMPTSAGDEDITPMTTPAVRNLVDVVGDLRRVVALEAVAACQALDLRGRGVPESLRTLYDRVRACVPTVREDRALSEELEDLVLALSEDVTTVSG